MTEQESPGIEAWPISFEIAPSIADAWTRTFSAECAKRGWGMSSQAQTRSTETSGTITVNPVVAEQTTHMEIQWTRSRIGPLKCEARVVGGGGFSVDDARAFLRSVGDALASPSTQSFHLRNFIFYFGLPWRGELWLDDTLRLGPPSKQYEAALYGPRVIAVDATVPGLTQTEAGCAFEFRLREVACFLSVVLRQRVYSAQHQQVWGLEIQPDGTAQAKALQLGYVDDGGGSRMPTRGQHPSVPMERVTRPDLALVSPGASNTERSVPHDILELWQLFSGLGPEARQQFLEVAKTWQLALLSAGEHQTASTALLVVACEALKPVGHNSSKKSNRVYFGDILKALVGDGVAQEVDSFRPHPQGVRDNHLHNARALGRELTPITMFSTYMDPTFDQMVDGLRTVTPAAIIEWLRRGGGYTLP